MNIIGVIPARMNSSRFPGKPLKKILGVPMIEHVYRRAKLSKKLKDVYVATCDKEIFNYVVLIGGKAIMTKNIHERPTERVIEAIEKIEARGGKLAEATIMIQGDEPMVRPDNIDAAAEFFSRNKDKGVVNLVNQIIDEREHQDKDAVKLITGFKGRAVWFFRQLDGYLKKSFLDLPVFIQTGIIGFRRDKLFLYKKLKPTPLERANSVDMLRFIEHDESIYTLMAKNRLYSVDTKKDLKLVEKAMKDDELAREYL